MDVTSGSAVVTGGASGLGLATARRLVEKGVPTVLVDLDDDLRSDRGGEGVLLRLEDPRPVVLLPRPDQLFGQLIERRGRAGQVAFEDQLLIKALERQP